MNGFLTYEVAVVLMIAGAIPSFINVYLLWDHRYELGVSWFILSMITGGLWALVYTAFTVIRSPEATLFLANFFWALVPTAAVTMFLLAYEFVFKQPASRVTAGILFAPVLVLFVLSWGNPNNLVFTAQYSVDSNGFLSFPRFGGPLKILVTQVYGYLLVFLASGMFIGEIMRTTGIRRKRVLYLLLIFSILVASTMIKVAGVVPTYFDPTSVVYSASGLMFAYSINKYGLFKSISIGRERTFDEVDDVIIVVDSEEIIVDVNHRGQELFGKHLVGTSLNDVIPGYHSTDLDGEISGEELLGTETDRQFNCRTSPIEYGRGEAGRIMIISDITDLKRQEQELNLLVQIFSRVYRHNMRTDFNIVQGHLENIRSQGSEEVSTITEQIDQRTDKLLQQATKARKIERIFSSSGTISYSLREFVEAAQSSFEDTDAVVFNTAVSDIAVDVNPHFTLALSELIDNAIRHHPKNGSVVVDIQSEETAESVTLIVADNGTGIPEYELSVLRAGEETDLQHSSGIGLWLVRAVVTRSNGEFLIEATGDGTEFRIELPRSATD